MVKPVQDEHPLACGCMTCHCKPQQDIAMRNYYLNLSVRVNQNRLPQQGSLSKLIELVLYAEIQPRSFMALTTLSIATI